MGDIEGRIGTRQACTGLGEERSDAFVRALVDHAPDAMFVHDDEGRFVEVNDRACFSLGYSRKELLALSIFDVGATVDRAAAANAWSRIVPGQPFVVRGRQRRKDGTTFPVEVRFSRFEVAGRRFFVATASDLTAWERDASEVREAEARRLDMLMRTSVNALIVTRIDGGTIVDANDAYVRLVGWSREELLGRTSNELGLFADPDVRPRIYAEIARAGSIARMEVRAVTKSGTPLECFITVERIEIRGERCAIGFWEDVTERRRVEAALRDSENELRAIFDTAPVGIVQVDIETMRFTRVNGAMCAIMGYSAEELCTKTITDVTHADDRARDSLAFARARGGQHPGGRFDKRYVRKDGRTVWASVQFRSLRDAGGRVTCTIATIEDVTEQRQADALRRLQTSALQAAANGIAITDTTGKIEWVNDAFTRLTGYESDEAIGVNPRFLKSGSQDDAFYRDLWKTIIAGRTWQGELVNQRKDGSFYREDMTITPVHDGAGAVSHFIAIKQDVTDRKRNAEAMVAAEERHRLALDATDLGTWRHDIASNKFHLDTRAQAHFALESPIATLDEMIARVHPLDLDRLRSVFAAAYAPSASGRTSIEHRVVLPSGEERWLSMHVRVHFTGTGAERVPSFAIGTSLDVTDATVAADALRASEDRYRGLVDNLDEVVFSVDTGGVVTFVSAAIARFGYTPEEVVGRSMDDLVHPDDRATARLDFASRLAGAAGSPFELRWVDATGKTRFLRNTTRRIVVRDRVVGLTGLAADVTERRDTEEQLRAGQRMEAIGRLAGGVAHDFNNLLCVILSYTELAVNELREEDPLHADLKEVVEAAKRAEGLTRQLLAFSRRQVLQPEPVDVGALVASLSTMLRRLIGEDVELVVSAADDLVLTKVDRGQTEQVVMNLAINARDAMPDGGVLRISATNTTLDAAHAAPLELDAGEYVEIAVADSGCGMPPEVQARIFEPFFTTKAVGKGTGLGLSTVHGIVKQSKGGISVETSPGRGTTFRVYFPRHFGDQTIVASQRPIPASATRGTENVLVVEDEAALRNVLKRMLSSAGYKVSVAANPGEALLICEQLGRRMDLVLTDVVMPGMSGRELAVRLGPLCPSARVMFMSGYTDDAIEHHGVLGQRFLRKPFDRDTLVTRVREVLDEG